MTNAEKYLKVSVNEFFKAIINSQIDIGGFYSLQKWLLNEAKPTLTEDERVILNHINVYEFDKIARANNGDLYLHYREDKDTEDFWWCNHLFQFIKERRRILYRGTFERRINGTNKHIHKQ